MPHGHPDFASVATTANAELPTYSIAFAQFLAFNAAAQHVLGIFNPVGSGKVAKLRRLYVAIQLFTSNDARGGAVLYAYRTTTLGGAPLGSNLQAMDPSDPASSMQIGAGAGFAPATAVVLGGFDYYSDTRKGFELLHPGDLNLDRHLYQHPAASQEKPLYLRPGGGIAIIAANAAFDVTADIFAVYTEELA
jgi:hypothetical protein